MKERPTIIVIGGGVSGLSAGINGEQNGMHVILLESQPYVGGFCTGWYRKGRYLDGCLHWLTGTNPNTDLYKMWKNVHALEKDEDIIYLDSFGSFERDGVTVTLHHDINKAEKEWLAISPEDKKEIRRFFNMVRDFVSVETPASKPAHRLGLPKLVQMGISVLKVWPSYLLTMKMSTDEYAKKFKHPAIRHAIANAQPGAGNLFSMLYSYATIVSNNGGIPKGGSKALAERMKDYFLDLGGTIKTNSEVEKILVKNNRAYGVRLKNGNTIYGDYVVTAISPEIVTHKLLNDPKYIKPRFEKRLHDTVNYPTPSCCLLQFEIEDIPKWNIPYNFQVEELKVGTRKVDNITLRSYAYDPDTFVKDNKTIVSCLLDQYDDDFFYWEGLYKMNKDLYYKKKQELGEDVLRRILARFPELEGKVNILDVATPHTLHRYTNSTRGAYMSFLFTKKNMMYTSGRIAGLKNLYLAGQWVATPGGLPFAMMTGYYAIQRICRNANMSYVLSTSYRFKRIEK